DRTGGGHFNQDFFEESAAVLGPTSGGDLLVGPDVEGDHDLVGVFPAHVPDHHLVLDGGCAHDDPPGAHRDKSFGFGLGSDASGHLNRHVDLADQPADQVTVAIVAVGGGVEIDDV